MGCCSSGGGPQKIRTQRIKKQKQNKSVVTQVIKRNVVQAQTVQPQKAVRAQRQSLVRNDRCPKCQSPVMLVNIARRERKQCTSANCKHIIK